MEKRFAEFLSAENSVLALIDHQTGLLSSVRDIEPDLLKTNLIALAKMAKEAGIPVVITSSMPEGPNGPFIQEILDILPEAKYIKRPGEINAWDNEEFRNAIVETGRKKIIMAGIVTDVCLMFPALSALADGFDPYAIIDASGTWNKLVQEVTVQRLAQAGVKVSTWASALAEIMHDWRSEKAYPLAGVLSEHTSYGLVYESFLATQNQNA
ncbi:isochorismatase family protein [Aureibacter tunicatorum]|uniref:Nicotinamidase-related amidase n=1 Tax=Aureibacter tunicatorum TaxID=866807 RepID=A0AAE4BUD7_9BACT|nr:isochorismatase family protein [Aureibacter tunicatorum]MDR6240658.1 nicotinamidase-related amidase [Aureibacter tunicatorum]BDD07009.1 hydrolase [Aureibacter tunicatorum]